jgi:hypothetical protein
VSIVYKGKKRRHNHSFGVIEIIYFIFTKDKEKIKEISPIYQGDGGSTKKQKNIIIRIVEQCLMTFLIRSTSKVWCRAPVLETENKFYILFTLLTQKINQTMLCY